jgi:sugar phosphate isomerase/epimerase
MTRKIGLAALTALELSPAQLVSVAAEAGYECVGLRLIPVTGQVPAALDLSELKKRVADTGVRVLDVEIFRLEPATDVAAFEPVMAAAQQLGATELLVHGADPEEARLVESFARLCELAASHGLNANIEPMPWVHISTVAKAMRILDGAGKKNGALLVDAIHFFRAGDSFSDLKGMRLRYAQFCDAPAERPADMKEIIRQAREDRLMPGEGGLDLKGLLAALPPDLPLSVEIPYKRPMGALERARLALQSTRKFL